MSDTGIRRSLGRGAEHRGRNPMVERTFEVPAQRVARNDAESGGERNRKEQAHETEERSEGEQREHEPDWMKTHRRPDKLRRQDIALDELTEHEDPQRREDPGWVWPELDD